MKKITYILSLVLTLSLTLTGCSDSWSDHYDAQSTNETAVDGTIWDVISSDPTLSNFSSVIEECGYNSLLESMQSFTLFVPTNDNFTEKMRDSIINVYMSQKNATRANGGKELRNEAVSQFIYNHLSRYKTSVESGTDTMINMMNGKRLLLTENSFDGKEFVKSNIKTNNGMVFYIKSPLVFKPNIYEYITRATDRDTDLDSLNAFLTNSRFCFDEFDAESSVPGDIVDGKTQYLDSVTTLRNTILERWYGAALNSEDSTYILVAMTNDLWKQKLEKYQKYFKYDETDSDITPEMRDSIEYTFPRWAIISGTAFSKTFNSDQALNDSAFSTNAVPYRWRYDYFGSYKDVYYQYDKPYASGGIFDGTTEVQCSNGMIKKASTLNAPDTVRFMQKLKEWVGLSSEGCLDSVWTTSTSTPIYNIVTKDSPFYDKLLGHAFVTISPNSNAGRPTCQFHMNGVLSNLKYKVYLLTVPAISGDTLDTDKDKSTKYRVTIRLRNNGKNTETVVKPEGSSSNYVDITTNTGDVVKQYLGTYKFDYSSFGLEESRVKIRFESRQTGSDIETKRIRLSAIIFEPEEE